MKAMCPTGRRRLCLLACCAALFLPVADASAQSFGGALRDAWNALFGSSGKKDPCAEMREQLKAAAEDAGTIESEVNPEWSEDDWNTNKYIWVQKPGEVGGRTIDEIDKMSCLELEQLFASTQGGKKADGQGRGPRLKPPQETITGVDPDKQKQVDELMAEIMPGLAPLFPPDPEAPPIPERPKVDVEPSEAFETPAGDAFMDEFFGEGAFADEADFGPEPMVGVQGDAAAE